MRTAAEIAMGLGALLLVLTLAAPGFHWLAERLLRGKPEYPAPRPAPEPEPWDELDEHDRAYLRGWAKHNKP